MPEIDLFLRGLRAPVRLSGGGWTQSDFAPFLPNWPFDFAPISNVRPFAALNNEGGVFTFGSDFSDGVSVHKTLVNAVCDLIAHAARQRTVERPGELCMHAAAVRIGAGLVVMPAMRRAGKSVMTAALAAQGHAVFSDDVLPIKAAPGTPMQGLASGVAIRLRLPLPGALPGWFQDHLTQFGGPKNRQYQYLPAPQLVENGTAAPLLALVSLDFIPGAETDIKPMPRGQMLKSLLKQNFARESSGDNILLALLSMAQGLPCYHLTYSDLDAGVRLLVERLSSLAVTPVVMPDCPAAQPILLHQAGWTPDQPMIWRKGATVMDVEGEAFGVTADQRMIVHLDAAARRIWALFDQPTSATEVIAILRAAFPDAAPAQIKADANAVVQRFARAGLLVPA